MTIPLKIVNWKRHKTISLWISIAFTITCERSGRMRVPDDHLTSDLRRIIGLWKALPKFFNLPSHVRRVFSQRGPQFPHGDPQFFGLVRGRDHFGT
ncbi:MAG: hypothetical protein DMG80_19170 [Acidobacteria bacterium]|nr:MAG: hypothetical protein DMG80_19170 [Acidobacteriota bacterium]